MGPSFINYLRRMSVLGSILVAFWNISSVVPNRVFHRLYWHSATRHGHGGTFSNPDDGFDVIYSDHSYHGIVTKNESSGLFWFLI